jgi:hypothetical protein
VLFAQSRNGDYNLKGLYVICQSQFVLKKKPSVLESDATSQFLAKKPYLSRIPELLALHLDCHKLEGKESM